MDGLRIFRRTGGLEFKCDFFFSVLMIIFTV